MPDLARIGFAVDSSQVDKGVSALNKLTPATQKAEAAAEGFNAATTRATSAVKAAAGGLPGLTSNMQRAAGGFSSASAAIASVATSSTMSTRAALAAGTSLSNMASAATATANAHERLRQQTMAVTGGIESEIRALQRLRDSLQAVPPAANEAGSALNRLGAAADDNINKMQATPGNVAAQFQDVAVTAAGGMNPLLIALQQGTQLGAAMSGGIKTLAAGFMQLLSPVNLFAIALTAAVALLIQWGIEAFKAGDETDKLGKAIDETRLTTSAFSGVQNALSTVLDITTGKVNTQSEAMRGLARAQLEVIRATALRDKADATRTIAEQRGRNAVSVSFAGGGSMTAGTVGLSGRDLGPNQRQTVLDQFIDGKITSTKAIDGLEKLRNQGKLTEDAFIKLTGAISNFGVATENMEQYRQGRAALEGDRGALQQFLEPKNSRTRTPRVKAAKKPDDPWGDLLKDVAQQQRELEQAGDRIGLYGQDLDRLTFTQELFNKAQDKGIKLTKDGTIELTAQGLELQKRATLLTKIANDNRVAQFNNDLNKSFEDQAEALRIARGEIGLTGIALIQYRLVQEALNKAKALGITLDDEEIARIRERAREIGVLITENDRMTESVRRQEEQLRFAKDTVKGLFTEWVQNVRQGQNVFTAFANSVLNALNRILDRLLDKALDAALDAVLPKGTKLFAKGGAVNDNGVMPFAKGGAFTNSIVDSPTLFKFAKGTGLMGEAGPEAIVPLKRGSDGSLGVQMHGGSARQAVNNTITNAPTYHVGGVMTPEAIIAAIRQGDEQSRQEIAVALPALLSEYQRNGTTG